AYGVVDRRQRLLERNRVEPRLHLPEVEVVDSEPEQRGVQLLEQGAPGGVPLAGDGRDTGLRRHDHLVAGDDRPEKRPEGFLARAVSVGDRGVDERPTRVDEGRQLVASVVFVGVSTPRESPEPDPRDLDPAPPDVTLAPERSG